MVYLNVEEGLRGRSGPNARLKAVYFLQIIAFDSVSSLFKYFWDGCQEKLDCLIRRGRPTSLSHARGNGVRQEKKQFRSRFRDPKADGHTR